VTVNAYTEDQLVEQPAIGPFAVLGWQTVSAMEEVFGLTGTLGRETSGEVVLVPRMRAALEKLNPKLPPEAITSALDELTRDQSAMTLAGANRELCGLLKDGVKVSVPDRERGGVKDERQLLDRLNALLVLGWRQKTQARARICLQIEDTLDELPPAYDKELYEAKCTSLFEHVYEAYQGDGASVYVDAAA